MDSPEQQDVLARINASISSTVLRDIVLAEATVLGLSLGGYQALSEAARAAVMRDAFSNRPATGGYADVAAFNSAFDSIVLGEAALFRAVAVANDLEAAPSALIDEVDAVLLTLRGLSASGVTSLSGQLVSNLVSYGDALISIHAGFDHPGQQAFVEFLMSLRPTTGYTSFGQVMTVVQGNAYTAYTVGKQADVVGKAALAQVNAASGLDAFDLVLREAADALALDREGLVALDATTQATVISEVWAQRPADGFASVSALNTPYEQAVQAALDALVVPPPPPPPPPEEPVVLIPEPITPSEAPASAPLVGEVASRKGVAMAGVELSASSTTDVGLRLEWIGEQAHADGSRTIEFGLIANAGAAVSDAVQFQIAAAQPTVAVSAFAADSVLSGWAQVQAIDGGVLRFAAATHDAAFTATQQLGTLIVRVDAAHDGAVGLAVDGYTLGSSAARSVFLQYDEAATVSGGYQLDGLQGGLIDLSLAASAASLPRTAITAQDALEALRLAVRLPSEHANPYGYIAADYNQDGRVTSLDALEILKASVRMPDAIQPKWVFLSDEADLSGITSRNTGYKSGLTLQSLPVDASHNFTGVLLGDVNDSLVFV